MADPSKMTTRAVWGQRLGVAVLSLGVTAVAIVALGWLGWWMKSGGERFPVIERTMEVRPSRDSYPVLVEAVEGQRVMLEFESDHAVVLDFDGLRTDQKAGPRETPLLEGSFPAGRYEIRADPDGVVAVIEVAHTPWYQQIG